MEVERCTSADVEVIADLEARYIECPWSQNVIKESIANPTYSFFRAVDGQKTLGYGAVQIVFDEGNICNVAVYEQYRNKGVGKCIINSILDECRAKGVTKVFLEVSESNASALALYTKLGFDKISVRKNYYKSGNAIIMSLNL